MIGLASVLPLDVSPVLCQGCLKDRVLFASHEPRLKAQVDSISTSAPSHVATHAAGLLPLSVSGSLVPYDISKPHALTAKVQAAIIKYLAEGNYFETACLAAGVTSQTVRYWRGLWESGHESAYKYDEFFSTIARAQAIAEVNAVKAISEGKPGWQGPAWLIERRHPKRWNRKQHVDVTSDGKAMKSAVIEMPAKDLHDQDQATEGPADDVPRKPR